MPEVAIYPVRPGRCPCCGGNPPLWTASDIVGAIQRWVDLFGRIPSTEDWERASGKPRHPSFKTVVLIFGSWNNGIRAAGFSARRHHSADSWTNDELLEAIQRWASEHGGVPPTVKDWIPAPAGYPSSSLVCKRFGTWNKAIDEAGYFPRFANGIYTNHLREHIVRTGTTEGFELPGCKGCGADLDSHTTGCMTCWHRHRNRRRSADLRTFKAALA